MPRTKVSRNVKRNRDAANREEKIREFDVALDQFLSNLDCIAKRDLDELDEEIENIKNRLPQKMLKMKIGDLVSMNITKFSQMQNVDINSTQNASRLLQQSQLSSSLRSGKKSKDDEGYLTEDSTASGGGASTISAFANLSHLRVPMPSRGRTPGPLSSAKARRPRRSKSACGDYVGGSAIKPSLVSVSESNTEASDHASRSKLRTPLVSRTKAHSADRTPMPRRGESPTSPTALLRWPKPGEKVVSMFGTPVVSQVAPEWYANVNIPIKNGVLSLRPRKMASLNPDIIDKIDPETLDQIKTLQSNLNLIMRYADKSAIN